MTNVIKHFQRFGINVDDWPEPNEDGTYPDDDDNADNSNTEKPDEIDEMITDEDVDDTGEPDDDDDDEMCEPEDY
jgi:hypothetical protein